MQNGTKTAYPHNDKEKGLTKREQFAAMAMQGILANQTPYMVDKKRSVRPYVDNLAIQAIQHADALLEQLEKN